MIDFLKRLLGIQQVIKLDLICDIPTRAHPDDACEDIRAADDYVLEPWKITEVQTHMRTEIPPGFFFDVRPRSGLSGDGAILTNSCGTIDAGYRGFWSAKFLNATDTPIHIKNNQKIAQARLVRLENYVYVHSTDLSDSSRGTGGYGSTGRH